MDHMKANTIPAPIKNAAIGMLSEYVDGLTAEKLEAALCFQGEGQEAGDKLRTKKEAAETLSISSATLNRLLASGQIRRIKIRGAVRIPQSAIDEIINGTAAA
jgi:excisionase family DNA binding protein